MHQLRERVGMVARAAEQTWHQLAAEVMCRNPADRAAERRMRLRLCVSSREGISERYSVDRPTRCAYRLSLDTRPRWTAWWTAAVVQWYCGTGTEMHIHMVAA